MRYSSTMVSLIDRKGDRAGVGGRVGERGWGF